MSVAVSITQTNEQNNKSWIEAACALLIACDHSFHSICVDLASNVDVLRYFLCVILIGDCENLLYCIARPFSHAHKCTHLVFIVSVP